MAAVIVNWAYTNLGEFTLNFSDIDIKEGTPVTIRDLWAHQDIGVFQSNFTIQHFNGYQSFAYRITPHQQNEIS